MFRKTVTSMVVVLALALPATSSFAATAATAPAAPTAPAKPAATAAPAPAKAEVVTLDKALELATANSQSVKTADKNVEIAQETVKQAQAGFMPSVSYSAGATTTTKDSSTLVPVNPNGDGSYDGIRRVDLPDHGYTGSVKVTQPLFTGGKLTYTLEIAKLQLASAEESQRKAQQTLAFNVKQAYYQTWLAQQMVGVAQSSYDNLGHHVDQVEHFYKVGTASKFDLLQAQVQHDGLKPNVITAQNNLALARLNLAILIGYPKDRTFEVSYDASQLKLPDQLQFSNAFVEEAYQNRPEMKQIHQQETMAEYQTKLAEVGDKPTIALTGSYDGSGADLWPGKWDKSATLTLGVTGLIWDGNNTKSKVTAAKKQEEVVALQESSLKDSIRLDVEQSQQSLTEALETTRANQSSIDLARESLRLTQARYNAGLATTMDIMDAQLALDKALTGYYQGVVSYQVALAKIDLARGK